MRFNVPVLALEGSPTADGRLFDAWEWRALPLPLMLQDTGAHGGEAGPSLAAGRIVEITSADGTISAVIDTDDGGEAGAEAARLIQAEVLTGISVDYSWADEDLAFEETTGEDGEVVGLVLHWSRARIMGATLVGFPAFEEARVNPTPDEGASPLTRDEAARVASLILTPRERPAPRVETEAVAFPEGEIVVASARLVRPPLAWFDDPQLEGPTRLSVTDEGRVYGHVAYWDACHVGFSDHCVPPPRSSAGYPHFRTGTRETDAGPVRTGPLVIGADHAPVRGTSATQAIDHYAHAACAWADAAAGDDAYGIWVAGALRPGVTEEQLVAVRGSAPSGDWRRIDGRLELVAVLSVNTPGYRDALAASASEVLTASAEAVIIVSPTCSECGAELEEEAVAADLEVRALATIARVLEPAARASLRARLRAS